MREDRIQIALDACYEAVITPSLWADALQDLASTFDSAAMMFYPYQVKPSVTDPRDPNRKLSQTPTAHGYQELIVEYERGSWYLNHYRAERGFPLMQAGNSVVIEHQLASDDERRSSRHYNELYLRYGFPGYAMVNVPMVDQSWCIPMVRSHSHGHFTPEDAAHLNRLIPHFRRLISLSDKLDIERGLVATAGLEAVNAAAVLIDWHGGIRSINASAEALLGDDLMIIRGALFARNAASDRSLKSLIRHALSVDRSLIGGPRPSTTVARQLGRPILVEAMPVSGIYCELFGHARALLLLTDLNYYPVPHESRIRSVFGLTAAEAKLAAQLAAGRDMREVADLLGITYETARSQLRAVFGKTGTRRQAELVSLLARLPG